MTTTAGRASPSLGRRWRRWVLRTQGALDENGDRYVPWVSAAVVFATFVALDAAALRSADGGSGIGPWLQAAWAREHGGADLAVGGVDPARGAWSFVSGPLLYLTRAIPPEAVFTVVQSAAIALAIVPLWRLARDEAHLRIGTTMVITTAYALAPTLHRANLTSFHPELIALPALLWAYLRARQQRWVSYAVLIGLVLACRADLGLTVAALGLLLVTQGHRRQGLITSVVGLGWSILAVIVVDPQLPDRSLTPAGEFVARATGPLAALPSVFLDPRAAFSALFAEPAVLFLVVVLSPLVFLPLVSPRALLVAMPCLILAVIADGAVQSVAQTAVLDLSPAAAHVAPAMAFVFVALVFALERAGDRSVSRVNVDHRVLLSLLAAAVLLFVVEAPTSPYRQPWQWGGRDALDGARRAAADAIDPDAAVAVSPSATALVAGRSTLLELPADAAELTSGRIRRAARTVDAVLLDTSDVNPVTDEPLWPPERREEVIELFGRVGFAVTHDAEQIYVLERSGTPPQEPTD